MEALTVEQAAELLREANGKLRAATWRCKEVARAVGVDSPVWQDALRRLVDMTVQRDRLAEAYSEALAAGRYAEPKPKRVRTRRRPD